MKTNCLSLPVTIFLSFLATTGVNTRAAEAPTLKDAFKNDFLIGAALNASQFSEENRMEASIVKQQFNCISPENCLKWESVHPEPGRFDFSQADRYVAFGQNNGMTVIGHNLIWHNQTPKWVFEDDQGNPVDRATLLARMHDHIFTVVGRYRGKIHGWDVVNEAVDEDGSLRQSPWFKILGEGYLLKAYQFAHEADPGAELYYNDYSLENMPKQRGAIALIKKLQSQGVRIAAVGLQGHYNMNWPSTHDIDETISAFATLGVKVNVTELDINMLPSPTRSQAAEVAMHFALRGDLNPYTNGLPDAVEQQLAHRYSDIFRVFLKDRAEINRVTFWGVTDGDSWLNDWPIRGRTSYPLLFDRSGQAKAAFTAVIKTVAQP
jgi:endo-1,4-beta-xylanase